MIHTLVAVVKWVDDWTVWCSCGRVVIGDTPEQASQKLIYHRRSATTNASS